VLDIRYVVLRYSFIISAFSATALVSSAVFMYLRKGVGSRREKWTAGRKKQACEKLEERGEAVNFAEKLSDV